jgi:hypothetical protein
MSKYLYCVIRCSEPRQFVNLGIGERGDVVHTIHFKDLAVVASDSPVIRYDGRRRNMMAHTVVLEEAMQAFTILPIRFGTVAPHVKAIEDNLLKSRYDELVELLNDMEGRVELGVKAFWYEEVIFNEVVEENPPIRRLRDSLMGRTPEETYYERIRLGELIETAMGRKRAEDADKLLARLEPLAYKTRTNKTIMDRMVLNAAFLVERSQEKAFDQAMSELDNESGKRLMLKYVGPVPPYNFVDITVQWDQVDRIQ